MIPPGSLPGVATPNVPSAVVAGGCSPTRKTYWGFTPEEALRALHFIAYRKWHMPARPPRHVGNHLHVDPRVAWLLAERAA